MYTQTPQNTILDFMNFCNSYTQQQQQQFTQKQVQNITNKNTVGGKYEVFLKAAKGREDQYKGTFPTYLLCKPYKYDLKIKGTPIDEKVTVVLLDRETKKILEKNQKKNPVSVASVEKLGNREIVIRFSLNLCSFHYKKKDFILKVISETTREELFISTPFHTYARKRRTNKKTKKESAKKRKFVSIKNEEEIFQAQFPLLKKIKCMPSPSLVKQQPQAVPVKNIVPVQPVVMNNPTASSPLNFEELLFEENNFINDGGLSPLKTQDAINFSTVTPTMKKQKNYFSLDDLEDVANSNDLFENFEMNEKSTLTPDNFTNSIQPSYFNQTITSPTLLPDFVVGKNNTILGQLESQQRTSLAIQLMNQLSPTERQKVSMYMSCNNNPQHV